MITWRSWYIGPCPTHAYAQYPFTRSSVRAYTGKELAMPIAASRRMSTADTSIHSPYRSI